MPSQHTAEETQSPARGSRLRFELIFLSAWLAVGLFVVPALVYWVDSALLGPYGENAGLSAFYGAYFADLASFAGWTWLLALGPLIVMSLVRVLFIGVSHPDSGDDDLDDNQDSRAHKPRQTPPAESRRIEPRVDG